MSNRDNIIFVSGATGQQGGAVARHLLAKGHQVRALTRDANSDKAKALAAQGAEIAQGDLNDRASFESTLQGVYGVFSVQNFWPPGVGFDGEVRQGKNLADAAQAANVKHFVYSSVGASYRSAGQRHFDSKWAIEQHIHAISLPHTIFRPVLFMDNYNWQRAGISNGVFGGFGLRPDKTVQMIAVDDIGAFVALAFDHPQDYLGKTIEIAGDEMTEAQIAATFSKVIGRPVSLAPTRMPQNAEPTPEQIAMFNFFNGRGYEADIPTLRKAYPQLRTLERWLRETGWENLPVMELPPQAGWGRR